MASMSLGGVATGRVRSAARSRLQVQKLHLRVAAVAFSAAALLHGVRIDPRALMIAAVVGVVIVGLPHGQFDWRAARTRLSPRLGRRWPLVFLLAYLGLAAIVALLWVLSPSVGFTVFLACSALHFGVEDLQAGAGSTRLPRALVLGVRGAAPFILPSAMHTVQTAWWVAKATGAAPAGVQALIAAALPWIWPIWAASAVVLLAVYALAHRWDFALEWTSACAALTLLPPVTGFLLWFLAAHAPRHVIQVAVDQDSDSEAQGWLIRELAWGALASAAVLAVLAALAARTPFFALQIAVAGLAAVTAPHFVVCTFFARNNVAVP